MVRYDKLAPIEKFYPFEDAVTAAEYINGTFGSVEAGVFTAGDGFSVIMQVENGDNAGYEGYKIGKGAHVRVAHLDTTDGYIVDVTAEQLPSSYTKGNKLKANAEGKLEVGEGDKGSLEIIEVTSYGVRAKIIAKAAD